MRAGRLLELMMLLQRHGKATASQLAAELEVSERTILRDIDALSGAGVPVYATRGANGGFQLLEGGSIPELGNPNDWNPEPRRPGRQRRVAVRVSPEGRRRAAVLAKLQPLRVRRAVPANDDGWVEATFRLHSEEQVVADVLSLGDQIEVISPPEIRTAVADRAARTAQLYRR